MHSGAELNTVNQKLLLTPTEVAQRLSLGRATVYQMIALRELPVVRVGRAIRVPNKELERWVEANTHTVQGASHASPERQTPPSRSSRSGGLLTGDGGEPKLSEHE